MNNIVCFSCSNYLGDLTCQAFSKGIPNEIVDGSNQHKEPLPIQDNEIVFEPLK